MSEIKPLSEIIEEVKKEITYIPESDKDRFISGIIGALIT